MIATTETLSSLLQRFCEGRDQPRDVPRVRIADAIQQGDDLKKGGATIDSPLFFARQRNRNRVCLVWLATTRTMMERPTA